MARRSISVRLAAPALLLGVLAAGCSDDGGGTDGGLVSGDGYSVLGALAEVPADWDDERIVVSTADLAAMTELLGVDPPSVADQDATFAWANAVTGARREGETVFAAVPQVVGLQYLAFIDEIDAELGWSVADVDAFVEAGLPPGVMAVVAGDVDGSTFDGGEVEDLGDGIVTAGSGDDHQTNLEERTSARPLGTPLRMATDDGKLVASGVTDRVRWWLDGREDTLAEDADFAAAAGALDDVDVVSAVLERPAESERGSSGPVVHGVGWSEEDGEAVITFVYVSTDEDGAEDLRARVEDAFGGDSLVSRRPISDLLELDDVVAEGNVVVATVRLGSDGSPRTAYDMLMARDLPFAL